MTEFLTMKRINVQLCVQASLAASGLLGVHGPHLMAAHANSCQQLAARFMFHEGGKVCMQGSLAAFWEWFDPHLMAPNPTPFLHGTMKVVEP